MMIMMIMMAMRVVVVIAMMMSDDDEWQYVYRFVSIYTYGVLELVIYRTSSNNNIN